MITGNTKKLNAAAARPPAHKTLNAYTYRGGIEVTAVKANMMWDGRNGYDPHPTEKITTFKLENGAIGFYTGEDFANVGDTYEVTIRFNAGYKGQATRQANRIWIKNEL